MITHNIHIYIYIYIYIYVCVIIGLNVIVHKFCSKTGPQTK